MQSHWVEQFLALILGLLLHLGIFFGMQYGLPYFANEPTINHLQMGNIMQVSLMNEQIGTEERTASVAADLAPQVEMEQSEQAAEVSASDDDQVQKTEPIEKQNPIETKQERELPKAEISQKDEVTEKLIATEEKGSDEAVIRPQSTGVEKPKESTKEKQAISVPKRSQSVSKPQSPKKHAPAPQPKRTNSGGQGSEKVRSEFVPASHLGGNLGNPQPPYPPISLRRREEGSVGLEVMVEATGRASSVTVIKSSGYPRLDQSAKNAVAKYRFRPAVENGRPIRHRYRFSVHFRLR